MISINNKTIAIISCLLFLFAGSNRLFSQSGVYLSSDSKLQNSIVWGNADSLSNMNQIKGNGSVAYTAVQGTIIIEGEGNKALEAFPFTGENFAQEAYSIPAGSSLINAGNNSLANSNTTDVAGYDRLWNEQVDMGAYEYQFPRVIKITATNLEKFKGEEDPELAYTLSGDAVLFSDSLSVFLKRQEGEDVNETGYQIDTTSVEILKKGIAQNITPLYNIEFTKGLFTIKNGTGIENQESNLSVYPTVTTGIVHISNTEGLRNIDVNVYDMQGKMLLQQKNMKGDFSIDLSAAPKGILFVKLSADNQNMTIKVIKR